MKIGDVEIEVSLNRDGTPYAAQEDILVRAVFRNQGARVENIPNLPGHQHVFLLQREGEKTERRGEFVPKATPGTVLADGEDLYQIGSGKEVAFNLQPAFALGFIAPGKYTLRLQVAAPPFEFASDWMPLEVSQTDITQFGVAGSPEDKRDKNLHLAWRDDGGEKPKILVQTIFDGKHGAVSRGILALEGAAPASIPVPAVAPSVPDPMTQWCGWIAGDRLMLAKIYGRNSATIANSLPAKVEWRLLHLSLSENPGDPPAFKLSGWLLGKGAGGGFLQGFQSSHPPQLVWVPPIRIGDRKVLAVHGVGFSDAKRYLLMAFLAGAKIHLEAFPWEDDKGMGAPFPLGEWDAADKTFHGLDAIVSGPQIVWGLALGSTGEDKGKALELWTHRLSTTENRKGPGIPKPRKFGMIQGPVRISFRFDAVGTPWILQKDVHAAWVSSPEWKEPIRTEIPRGSQFETLYFRRGELPRILLLNPDSGFESRPVMLPTQNAGEDEEMD